MPKSRKPPRKPIPDDIDFNLINPVPLETLLPVSGSKAAADAMFAKLIEIEGKGETSLMDTAVSKAFIRDALGLIASRYHVGRAHYHADEKPRLRAAAENLKINVAAIRVGLMDRSIRSATTEAAALLGALNVTYPQRSHAEQNTAWLGQLHANLDTLESACVKIIEASPQKQGPREKLYVRDAVIGLARLWGTLIGSRFSKNFARDPGPSGQFKSLASRWVCVLMQAMDDTVTDSDVQSAITKLDLAALD